MRAADFNGDGKDDVLIGSQVANSALEGTAFTLR